MKKIKPETIAALDPPTGEINVLNNLIPRSPLPRRGWMAQQGISETWYFTEDPEHDEACARAWVTLYGGRACPIELREVEP